MFETIVVLTHVSSEPSTGKVQPATVEQYFYVYYYKNNLLGFDFYMCS